MVLGAGGAARAVVAALAEQGAASVGVVNRNPERAERAADLAGSVGSVEPMEAIPHADLVVNATPVGMGAAGIEDVPFDPDLLEQGQLVADLVYHPLESALVRHARQRGCRAANGTSMLVHQAARAFETWTGEVAPVDAMAAAVTAGLR